ncbi:MULTISPECIES: YHYH domain-containing protein [Okeania]|uniref:YHYH domain-containing protein n=1 Tax=Okeania TaxID=1458928 RepID=UPI001F0089A0|nr:MULTISPECIES: YHYH domain-containing protein [Okeania]
MVVGLLTPCIAIAHSGRTDSSGCHTNRSTGRYHCHGGTSSGGSGSYGTSGNSGNSTGLRTLGDTGNVVILCSTNQLCHSLGYSSWETGDLLRAYLYYEKALSFQSNDLQAFTNFNILQPHVYRINGSCFNYEQCMNIGYRSTENKDYQTALINFKRALNFRPNDSYAMKAIKNVSQLIIYVQ